MSWHGSVTCSHCYERGHNQRGCPKLKAEAAANPNSYAASKLKQQKPRECSYCAGTGHNRRGCADLKSHKRHFVSDLHIWRQGLHKWAESIGLGYGALVRSPVNWRNHRNEHMDGARDPATLMFVEVEDNEYSSLNHKYATEPGIRMREGLNTEILGGEVTYSGSIRRLSLALPDLPVLAPAEGKDHYGYTRTRNAAEATWNVVSPSPAPGFPASFSSRAQAQEIADAWFQAGKDANTIREFYQLTTEQRKAIKEYLNDSATLDELHARLNPTDDDNSDSNNE